ncbi:hypothetical protein D3C77_574140 [compost metagenome]
MTVFDEGQHLQGRTASDQPGLGFPVPEHGLVMLDIRDHHGFALQLIKIEGVGGIEAGHNDR